jgi:hypothetical protein
MRIDLHPPLNDGRRRGAGIGVKDWRREQNWDRTFLLQIEAMFSGTRGKD